jgi:unsaturated rhamnogalacturonyl hydrolase
MIRRMTLVTFAIVSSTPIHAQTTRDLPDPSVYGGGMKVAYPTPYEPASTESIQKTLQHVLSYLEQATPIHIQDAVTGERISNPRNLPAQPALERTELLMLTYEWGVTYSGMLSAAEKTGDARYRDYTNQRLSTIASLATRIKQSRKPNEAAQAQPGFQRALRMESIIAPRSLDDSGSMCAAMIKAHRAGVGGELRPWIDNYLEYVSTKQYRLSDGTLARNRPMPNSLWLDDLYMSVPCLAQAGKLTGERRYFDDAAKQILQFAERMFVKERGLFMHGWVQDMDPHPQFLWARANGWAIMAMVELLEVLPEDHPDRIRIIELFRAHARGLAAVQGHAGLWHQLLDRSNSYEETSASAMFVYGFARGINRGWLDPLAYGPATSVGWNAVATKVNDKGQVEGTCVGTGMGWDPMFYMYRPVSVFAAHGYGPLFLAGAEMIELRRGKGANASQNGGLQFGTATSKH